MKHIFSNSNESAVARNSYRCATLALPLRKVFFTLSLLLTLSVGQMWAAWIGNSGINVNDTWYKCSSNIDGGNWLAGCTSFDGANLGAITSLVLGGQYDTWDNNQTDYCSWNSSNGIHILIKKGSTEIASFKLSCYHDSKSGNNNVWKTSGGTNGCSDSGSWGTYTVDISGYAAGNDYTIKATWFSPSGQSLNNTANFTINPVVTFKANGGTGSDYTQRVTYNTNTALTANTFTKTGYNFAGWATTSGGSVSYANQANVKLTSHTDLYAKWTAKTTTITLNNAGATAAGTTEVTATYDATIPTITIPTKTGYSFGGYWGAPGGTGPKYINADGTGNGTWLNTESTYTLYAAWAENKSTITLVASPSGKGTFQVGGETVTSTQAGVATTPAVTAVPIAGYSFSGWSITGGATISSTTDNPTTVTGDGTGTAATLTATFVEDLTYYTLKFNTRSGETSNGSVTAKDDSDNPLTSGSKYLSGTIVTVTATPEDDYKFDSWYHGWSTGSSFSTVNPLTFTLTEATNVYAHFVQKTTSITLNKNGGSGGTAGPVTATHGSTTLSTNPLVCPAKSGYTFTGYWTESSGGTKVIDTDGTLVASVSGYTKSGNKKWDYEGTTLTLYAQYTENLTTITVNVSPEGTGTLTLDASAFTPGNTTTAGKTTSHTVVATAANDYAFSSWSATGEATGTASTNTYTLKGSGNGSTGTLTANFTLIPVKLLYGSSTPLNSPTTGSAMSYDATEHAYYIDITTNSSPYYFRFDYNTNSEQYSGNWTSYPDVVEATGDGTKVDCNQTVKNWDNKASIKYSGVSGSSIRIWFDYQNKKAWITETTYSVTVAADAGGSVSPTSVSGVGATTASGDITATPDKGYVFTGWTLPSGISAAAGYSATSNPIRINATAASKTITANFAAATAFIEGRFHITNASRDGNWTNTFSSGNWDENSTRIKFTWDGTNNRYELHTYAKPQELSTQIGGYNPVFYVKESSSFSSLANVTSYWSSTSQTLTAAGTGNKKSLVSSGTFHNDYLRFNSNDESGYAVIYFDEAGIWYELEQRLQYNANGGTGSAPTGATGDNTYHAKNTTITAPANTYTRTGYTFAGWKVNNAGATIAAGASVTMSADVTLYAQWTAKTYTVTLDVDEAHQGNIASATTSQTVTYNAATTTVPNLPTAENGYGLMGYYTEAAGAGTKLINGDGTWIAPVAGYTDASSHWIHDDDVTLYAYYKIGTIANIELNAEVFEPVADATGIVNNDNVIANPIFEPMPNGTTKLCWELRYSNNNPVVGHAASAETEGDAKPNQVKFSIVGLAPGGYKIHVDLYTGSSCGGGTLLNSYDRSFSIASDHTVTIEYKCGDDVIKPSTTNPGKPLETTSITAPDIVGYTFVKWKQGDGITITGADANGEKATATITYTAIYDGKLTAIYSKKRLIYFNNTLGWSNVYVYFYKNANYWDNSYGTGSNTSSYSSSYTGIHGQMLPVSEGSQIYYFDAEAAGVNASYQDVAFTELEQTNYNYFAKTGTVKNKVIRRGDYKATTLPMFVPLAGVAAVNKNGNLADYYNEGYWMNYPENTGYVLKIYNSKTYGTSDEMQSIPFEFTANKTMPMSLTVELNANREYGFEIHRADGTTYGNNTKVMKINDSGDSGSPWAATSGKRTGIQTSVAGEYIFTLSFGNNGGYNYLVGVHYPVAVNDYRIVYKDLATWSQQEAHDASWHHPSRAIHKADGAQDTVSFYVSKATAEMKFQYAKTISNEGVVTWADVTGGTINLSGIENSGVYNFILTQAAGAISVEKIESYTGDYYIRTDCAGVSKWENYRAADHQMTYSEFSKNRVTNTFGELFSHYFTKWCPRGMNVKFCIANDYSSCISDTLIQDADNFYNNIYEGDPGGRPDGELKAQSYDGSGNITSTETDDRYSANIRFMYNEATNKISRAYIGSSTNEARKFLVLRGNATVKDEAGANLNEQGITNGLILHDDQNWIYERIIQIDPGTRFKLFACYAEVTPSEENAQYFRGSYDDNNFTNNTNSIILIDGAPESDFQKARIIYDFKTNRLVAAWMPSGSDISGTQAINADVMVVREHQNAAQTITFANDGKLSEVKTVYGAMKFNRWILNNRQHPEDVNPDHCRAANIESDLTTYHRILPPAEQKSIYERSLYFISFPFNVKVSEIFGFGKYWDEWYIEYYDGLSRAKNGYWKDSPPNWKYVTKEMADTYVLEANKGYILGLDLDFMQAENTTFWANGISTVELYFPSQATVGSIQSTAVTMPALGDEYLCTINRGTTEGDRRVKDSYWRCIGVPGYSNYSNILTDEESATITWQPEGNTFPFLYEWNMTDNTLTAQSTNRYNFKAMHAYLVQNGNEIHWSAISATPVSPIVARRAASQTEYLWRLTMECDGKEEDQAFIRMTDEEDVTDGFDFGQDLVKEYNYQRSDLYTYIGYERAAANSMPLHTEETTSIPVGVSIEKGGEYTFAMPDGTSGVGITLIDSETGAQTNLSAGFTYTVNFEKGDYNNRLYLEISPVSQISTGVDEVPSDHVQGTKARKVVIDGLLYIVKEGQMYDATGKHCK